MASEYLKQKYRNEKPEEPASYTRKEKAANWWYYHKWYVLLGVFLLGIVLSIGYHMLGIGEVEPDYSVAYVGTSYLPEQTVAALENALSALAPDSNKDGRTVVRVQQYVELGGGQSGDASYTYASTAALLADLERGESYFFLLEAPELFQEKYRVLRAADGGDPKAEAYYHPWASCPVLASLELGTYEDTLHDQKAAGSSQELLSRLSIARRGFRAENVPENVSDCDTLWSLLTEGAAPHS